MASDQVREQLPEPAVLVEVAELEMVPVQVGVEWYRDWAAGAEEKAGPQEEMAEVVNFAA